MDMWKPFRKSTKKKAPQAAILFDKFHIPSYLDEGYNKVKKQEYAELNGKKTRIKGQNYALLSHKENLQGSARKNLKLSLAANKRLNTAYAPKHSLASFGTTTGKPGRGILRDGAINSRGSAWSPTKFA